MTGEILLLHARDGIVDPATTRIHDRKPVRRLYANLYYRSGRRFTLLAPAKAGSEGREMC